MAVEMCVWEMLAKGGNYWCANGKVRHEMPE